MLDAEKIWNAIEDETGEEILVKSGILLAGDKNDKEYHEWAAKATETAEHLDNK